jgi:hypothetical protein
LFGNECIFPFEKDGQIFEECYPIYTAYNEVFVCPIRISSDGFVEEQECQPDCPRVCELLMKKCDEDQEEDCIYET